MLDCPYCKSDQICRVDNFDSELLRCSKCKLVFRYSKNAAGNIGKRDLEWEHDIHKKDQLSGRRNHVYDHVLKLLSSEKRGKLLDVGTGCGFFLLAAQKDGWQTAGVDPSKGAAQYAREVNKLDVIEGTLNAIESGDRFDVVTFINVIDMVDTPWRDVRKAHGLIKSGGRLYVRAPNGQMLIWIRKFFGMLGFERSLPELIVFQKFTFTPRFIRKMLSEQGFKDITIASSPISGTEAQLNCAKRVNIHSVYAKVIGLQRVFLKKCYLSTSLDIVATK